MQLLVWGGGGGGRVKAKICDHCSQGDHESSFCPAQIDIHGVSAYKKSEFRGSLKIDPKLDRLGCSKAIHEGAKICNNFNSKGCTFKHCNFLHVCQVCKSPNHGEQKCEAQKSKAPTAPLNSEVVKGKQKPVQSAWLDLFKTRSPSTPINVDCLENDLHGHPDLSVCSVFMQGPM